MTVVPQDICQRADFLIYQYNMKILNYDNDNKQIKKRSWERQILRCTCYGSHLFVLIKCIYTHAMNVKTKLGV